MKRKLLIWISVMMVVLLLPFCVTAESGKIVRITNYRSVNVRNGPDAGYKAIGSAEPGETFAYLGTKDNWNCIQYKEGVKGYVSGKLSVVEDAPQQQGKTASAAKATPAPKATPVPANRAGKTVKVGASISKGSIVRITNYRSVNVRTGPGTQYDAIGSALPEETYAYLGTENNWHCIQYAYGVKGYVSANLSALEEADGVKKITRITNYRAVNVRTGPGTQYDTVGSVQPEETFAYLGTENNWNCIQYRSGVTAYVSGNLSSVEIEGKPLKKIVIATESSSSSSSSGSSGSSSASGSSSSSGSSSWSSSSSSSQRVRTKRCTKCGGDGKVSCSRCNGSGGKYVYVSSPNYSGRSKTTSRKWESCSKCRGGQTQSCSTCGGDGKVEY